MSRKKKSGNKKPLPTEYILLVTAILELVDTLMDIIRDLIE